MKNRLDMIRRAVEKRAWESKYDHSLAWRLPVLEGDAVQLGRDLANVRPVESYEPL